MHVASSQGGGSSEYWIGKDAGTESGGGDFLETSKMVTCTRGDLLSAWLSDQLCHFIMGLGDKFQAWVAVKWSNVTMHSES